MPTPPAERADIAIVNARIFTRDPRRPWADALLVREGRIEALGSSAEVKKRIGGTEGMRVVDAGGMTVVPSTPSGTLEPGAAADLHLLACALARPTPEAIGDAPRVLSLGGGVVIFERTRAAR